VRNFESQNSIARHEVVQIGTLDDAMSEVELEYGSRRPYLKLDTQGYDLHVLDGGRRAMNRIMAMQLEASVKPIYSGMPDHPRAIAYAEALGFELSGMFPVTVDEQLCVVEYDCVMVRPSACSPG